MLQTRESAEFLLQTEQMGRSFVEWLKLHHDDAAEPLRRRLPITYPVAFAFAASRTEATVRDACLAFAFGWAENMIGAAVKARAAGPERGPAHPRPAGAQKFPPAVDQAIALADDDAPGLLADARRALGPPRNPVFPPVPKLKPHS